MGSDDLDIGLGLGGGGGGSFRVYMDAIYETELFWSSKVIKLIILITIYTFRSYNYDTHWPDIVSFRGYGGHSTLIST